MLITDGIAYKGLDKAITIILDRMKDAQPRNPLFDITHKLMGIRSRYFYAALKRKENN